MLPRMAITDPAVLREQRWRILTACWRDPLWRQTLAVTLTDEIWAHFAFESRFAPLGATQSLGWGMRPLLRRPGRVAWAKAQAVEVADLSGLTTAHDCPFGQLGFEVDVNAREMAAWGALPLRTEVLQAATTSLVEQIRERVSQLFDHATAGPEHAAREAVTLAAPGRLVPVSLAQGQDALFTAGSLILTTSGGLAVQQALSPDGRSWALRGRLDFSAVLYLESARRLFAGTP